MGEGKTGWLGSRYGTDSPLPGTALGSTTPSTQPVPLAAAEEALEARANDVATHTSPCWPAKQGKEETWGREGTGSGEF